MKLIRKNKILDLSILSIFITIIIIQTFVPVLGYIPLGFMNATIIHITVAIGSIILGLRQSIILGLVFGLSSIFKNTFMPNPSSFLFSPFISLGKYHGDFRSVIIAIIPRISVAIVSNCIYKYFSRKNYKNMALIFSGLLSSFANTILVVLFIYILYSKEYLFMTNNILKNLPNFFILIIIIQGLVEALISSILCFFIGNILLKVVKK